MAFGASIKYSEFRCRLNFSDGTYNDESCFMPGHEREGEPSRRGNAESLEWWQKNHPKGSDIVSVEIVDVENHDMPPLPPVM